MKTRAFYSKRWDLLTIFLVFIFHFIVNNTNKIVSEYKKKICKEFIICSFRNVVSLLLYKMGT